MGAAVKFDREKMAREAIRARERAEVQRLALALEHAKAHRRELVKAARVRCRRAKEALRVKLKERRRLERERLRLEMETSRKAERSTCKASCASARRRGDTEIRTALRALRETRAAQRLAASQASRRAKKAQRSTALERRQETDDEAERDIAGVAPDLVGVWRTQRRRFPGTRRMSRAEQFLHWAHENPGEVVALQSSEADREVARLIREHTQAQAKHRMRKTKRQIEAELRAAGVPF